MNLWDWVWIGLGVVVGVLAVVPGGRQPAQGSAKPTALGWSVLGFGLITALLSALATWGQGGSEQLPRIFAGGVATLIAGIGAIVKRERHWPTWAGLAIGVCSAAFWGLFLVAFILKPQG